MIAAGEISKKGVLNPALDVPYARSWPPWPSGNRRHGRGGVGLQPTQRQGGTDHETCQLLIAFLMVVGFATMSLAGTLDEIARGVS